MKIKNVFVFATVLSAAMMARADVASARASFQQQRAVQEVERLKQEFDLMNDKQEAIAERLIKVEGAVSQAGDTSDLRAEFAALKASIAELRRSQENLRSEIVRDLSKKIASIPAPRASTPPPAQTSSSSSRKPQAPAAPSYSGSYYEHVVEAGQNLSMIAKGYDTTVRKIKEANNMKNDVLRVGQKLIIPATEGK